jgi:nitrile hydratase accessory protein
MFTRFEEYAASSMLGQPDSPPRLQGKLLFSRPWEREVFGLALSLSKAGHFEWEDFRQHLIVSIADWENTEVAEAPSSPSCEGQPRWNYYERFLIALTRTLRSSAVLAPDEIAAIETLFPVQH